MEREREGEGREAEEDTEGGWGCEEEDFWDGVGWEEEELMVRGENCSVTISMNYASMRNARRCRGMFLIKPIAVDPAEGFMYFIIKCNTHSTLPKKKTPPLLFTALAWLPPMALPPH